jgi:hypothetical protein
VTAFAHKPLIGSTRIIQSVTGAISIYCIRDSLKTMKLDDWLTRLVAVPPGRSPLANGLAIGWRIALFILIPLGIIAGIAIVLLHR